MEVGAQQNKKEVFIVVAKKTFLRGRICLIKSSLSAISFVYLSFFRISKRVTKYITIMHNRFLWGGSEDKSSVAWLRWDLVCCKNKHGEPGMRYVGNFNKALISK